KISLTSMQNYLPRESQAQGSVGGPSPVSGEAMRLPRRCRTTGRFACYLNYHELPWGAGGPTMNPLRRKLTVRAMRARHRASLALRSVLGLLVIVGVISPLRAQGCDPAQVGGPAGWSTRSPMPAARTGAAGV